MSKILYSAVFILTLLPTTLFASSVLKFPKSYKTAKLETFSRALPSTKPPTEILRVENSVRCGGAFNDSNGSVQYKPFEQVIDNERCVWIISVPNAIGYTVDVLYLGDHTNSPNNTQELTITGIRPNYDWPFTPVLTTVKPLTTGLINVTNANVLLITFTSSSVSEGRNFGFALEYTELYGEGIVTSTQSTYHLLDTTQFEFHYPVDREEYDVRELAAIVFLPQNNVRVGGDSILWYKRDGIADACLDNVSVFQYSTAAKWQEVSTLCANVTSFELVHDDLVLALFQSDGSQVSTGFNFSYVHAGCSF